MRDGVPQQGLYIRRCPPYQRYSSADILFEDYNMRELRFIQIICHFSTVFYDQLLNFCHSTTRYVSPK